MNSQMECIDEIPGEWFAGSVDHADFAPPTSTAKLPGAGHGQPSGIALEFAGPAVSAGPGIRVIVPAADEEAQALANMELVRRMRSLVQWAEPGRMVTQTGAMRRGDLIRKSR